MSKVTVISEIGINHKGQMDLARLLITISKAAGADIAKFQWYRPEEIFGKDSPHFAEAKKCQFSENQHIELKETCEKAGIEWCVSIFHDDQVPFCEEQGMKRYKIASRAALNDKLLMAVATTGKPVILSTGLCNAERLGAILSIFGQDYPLTLLYCVCDYPTKPEKINFDKMTLLRNYVSTVGFSSHCPMIAPTLAAVAKGAKVTENHLVISKSQEGCDVSSSLDIESLSRMIGLIRELEMVC